MNCSKCGGERKVVETRSASCFNLPDYVKQLDPLAVFRRRICKKCDHRTVTIEVDVALLKKSARAATEQGIDSAIKVLNEFKGNL